ncbi:MAG: adenosylhomocysteinase, partial [Clostridia bacterium]|nr:adenosylhomocysteinase [Clostridia bacterium]
MEYLIRDINMAEEGKQKIAWVRGRMPILRGLEEEFEKEKPFKGLKITVSVHLEAKTAYLAKVLHAGGAHVRV